jgi:hypothetical protein
VTRRTLRSLWSHYLRVRKRLAEAEISGVERRMAEREARGLRDRLVVNYAPLVRYVAGRISGRMAGPLGSGGRSRVGALRAPERRGDLRSRAPHQVRVLCHLQDPVVHTR